MAKEGPRTIGGLEEAVLVGHSSIIHAAGKSKEAHPKTGKHF